MTADEDPNHDQDDDEEPLAGLVDGVGEGDDSDDPGEEPHDPDADVAPTGSGNDQRPDDAADVVPGANAGGPDEPLGELAGEVAARRSRVEGAEDDEFFERAFEDVGVEEADAEALWEDLESGSVETPVEETELEAGETAYVVDKQEYCQRCQHFSDPPDVSCGYEGSSIDEVEDTEHFRVTGCPIVAGEEDLQRRK